MAIPASRIREAFAIFDKDGDGMISGPEILLVIRSCGVMPTQEEIASLPPSMQWKDFEAWITKKLSSYNPEAELVKAFKVFDRNNDGTIAADELGQVMKALGELLTDEEVNQMLKDADPGNSGRIQYANFAKLLVS